jgi:hypothetical protein
MTMTLYTITTTHLQPINTSSLKRSQYATHTCMVEVCDSAASRSFVCDMFKAGSGQICQEDMSMTGWLSADFFGNVADGEIDRIGTFIPKHHHLSFVA